MRLIDADALIERCERIASIDYNKFASTLSWAHAYETFIIELEDAPTIEAEPVRHGEWVRTHAFHSIDEHKHICSCCGFQMYMTKRVKEMYKYCPKCGAKMDGGK